MKSIYFFIRLSLVCILSASFSQNINAQTTYTWTGSNSSAWNNSLNWTPNSGFPVAGDNAVITSAGISPVLDMTRCVANFTICSGTFDLNTFTLTLTGGSVFTNGNVNNGTIKPIGTSATFNGTNFGADVSANCASIFLNGSIFNGTSTFIKNGSNNNCSSGGNTFNGITSITNNGTGNMTLSNGTKDIFNSDVIFSTSTSLINVAENDNVPTQFNGNIFLNSTGNSTGIRFCQGAGSAVLANGKTISIGSNGFSSGKLYLQNFTQLGTTTQTMTSFSGTTALVLQTGTIFNGNVNFTAPGLIVEGTTFKGTATLEKTGTVYSYSQGDNIFNDAAIITNSGSSEFLLGGTTRDVFNGDVTFTSSGSSRINVGYSDPTGTLFNGNIILNSTNTSLGINFCFGGGAATLANGKTISIGNGGFSSGTLYLGNFLQSGSTPQTMNSFSGTSVLKLEGGNIFNGTTTITNSGLGSLDMAQMTGDDFNGDVTFVQTGGDLSPVADGASTFSGNISTMGSNAQINFGYAWNIGRMIIDGNGQQNFCGTFSPILRALTMSTTGTLNLNTDITILNDIAFTSGIINASSVGSTANGLLILNDGATISDDADNGSYVNGFVCKIGNSAFTFPVGNNGYYAPLSISAPSNNTDNFTAKYMDANPYPTYDTSMKDAGLNNISGCEHWILDRTGGSANVSVNLSWDTRSCNITALSDMRVTSWNGVQWRDNGNGATTGTTAAGTIVSSSAASSFGAFTLASTNTVTGINSLPIELLSFTGRCENQHIVLNWITATETNNDFFTVEKSADGINWENSGIINGAGTSSITHKYEFIAEENNSESFYYRLKQTDFDGKFKYSGIISVKSCKEDNSSFSIYPNPSNGAVNLLFSGDKNQIRSVEVFNSLGEKVFYSGNFQTSLDLTENVEGIYIVRINSGGKIISEKVMVEK